MQYGNVRDPGGQISQHVTPRSLVSVILLIVIFPQQMALLLLLFVCLSMLLRLEASKLLLIL